MAICLKAVCLGAQSVLDLAQPSPVAYPKAKSEFPSFPVAIENSLFRLRCCSVVRLNKMSEGEVEEKRRGGIPVFPERNGCSLARLLFFSWCVASSNRSVAVAAGKEPLGMYRSAGLGAYAVDYMHRTTSCGPIVLQPVWPRNKHSLANTTFYCLIILFSF